MALAVAGAPPGQLVAVQARLSLVHFVALEARRNPLAVPAAGVGGMLAAEASLLANEMAAQVVQADPVQLPSRLESLCASST